MNRRELLKKVISIASEQLARKQYVSGIEILLGLGYLSPNVLEDWRRGRITYLEQQLQVNLSKLSFVMKSFREWALNNGLLPRETAYVQKGTTRTIHLRFSKSGEENIEKYYRTHYISPELTEKKRQRLIEKIEKSPEPVAYILLKESKCSQCEGVISKGSLLMTDNNKPYCMTCSPYKDLVFLPSGDAKLTRQAKKYSVQCIIVVKFSRSRKRYERQGILITENGLKECDSQLG